MRQRGERHVERFVSQGGLTTAAVGIAILARATTWLLTAYVAQRERG